MCSYTIKEGPRSAACTHNARVVRVVPADDTRSVAHHADAMQPTGTKSSGAHQPKLVCYAELVLRDGHRAVSLMRRSWLTVLERLSVQRSAVLGAAHTAEMAQKNQPRSGS